MNLELTDEQLALRDTVARALASADPDAALATIGALERGDLAVVDLAVIAEAFGAARYQGPWHEQVARTDDELVVVRAADAVGAAQAVLDLAVDYAKARVQFGVPIGSFQAVQHLCVDMYETVELARGTVLHAAWALDVGNADATAAVARLRACADRLTTVGDLAIQVFGGIGFTWEHDAHRYLRRLLAWSASSPSPSEARRSLGRALIARVG